MADIYYEKGKEFEDYYPVEKCAEESRIKYACPKCGHLEMRVKLISYKKSYLFDSWIIQCEKCKTNSCHSG